MNLMTHPYRTWWTAAEIAEAGLPHMPGTQRGVSILAERESWRKAEGSARRRAGAGGGWEYHFSLFPRRAQAAIAARALVPGKTETPPPRDRTAVWAEFEALPEAARATARTRLAAVEAVEVLVGAGQTRQEAVGAVAATAGASRRTIWNWLAAVRLVDPADRLPWLAPRHRTAAREVERADCAPEAWEAFTADYLRLEGPALTSCYRRTGRLAAAHGWAWPSERSVRRKVEAGIERATLVLARRGVEGLKKLYPPQVRDKSGLHALECVNADGHKWDVAVRWPDGTIGRPMMVTFQDVYSGKVLSKVIDQSENRTGVLLAFGDMVEEFGIPDHCVMDNGRGFASKWVTGGIPNRYRFKVKADDPLGVMPQLGIQVHWTFPYSGRSKPIERAFRDMCEDIAKDPRFAGAWMGNRPDAKPENYGSRAIDLETFVRVVDEGIAEHNARRGRRSEICGGRSFDEAFAESYARAPIRKATPEQRRMWLLGVENLSAHRDSGALRLMENTYWADWLTGFAGQKLSARFDPLDLQAGLHVYRIDGRYLGHAACREKVGFLSMDDAQTHARANRSRMRAERERLKAINTMTVLELGRQLDGLGGVEPPAAPATKVVRGIFAGGQAAAAAMSEPGFDRQTDTDAAWEQWQRGVTQLYPRE